MPRQSLFERLSTLVGGGVTLVCAPAGSGKTMLVRSWIQAGGLEGCAGWVSLERGERDAQRFWLSVLDALAVAGASVQRVNPAPEFRGETFVEKLLADLGSGREPVLLVIDDAQELHSQEALRTLELFLSRLPTPVQVALVTREEPRVGLHRLRLAGRLTELRGADLRFSLAETKDLLLGVGVSLSDTGLALLHERTEGWAAGLRLAAISLSRHPEPERFVREFSGSERTVADYLLAEVMDRQSPEVREVLLRTSVLERVSGPLADHLTGGSGAERILQELEDANAFVTSLDAARTWFRYHHLFSDLLRLELRRCEPDEVARLHRAAAQWYDGHGEQVDAIRHAQAAEDWGWAARMLAESHIGLILDGRLGTVRALLGAFPDRIAAPEPELALVFADVRLRDGLPEEVAAYVADAERHAALVDADRRAAFNLRLASTRLELSSRRGDLAASREAMLSLEAALEAQPAGALEHSNDILALALLDLGTAEVWAMRLDDAGRHLDQALALARRIGRPYLEVAALAHLAIAAPLGGRSATTALDFTEQAIALAETHGLETDPVATLSFAVGAGSLAWLGRFAEAERWLERAQRALRPDESPVTELALHHACGLLRLAQGRAEDALTALRTAEETQAALAGEHALAVDVRMRIVLALVQAGHLSEARERLVNTPASELDRGWARVAAAAVALAADDPELAVDLLDPVIDASRPLLHPGWGIVHGLLFDAAARQRLGNRRGAEASLERALALAEPDGLILPFAIAPVREVIENHPRRRTAHPTFLAEVADVLAGASPPRRGEAGPPVEELSEAEMRVVRFLPTNLKAPEIAAELFVSTNTVRTHLRHIYAKLGAHGRAEAVDRARELRLLGPTTRPR